MLVVDCDYPQWLRVQAQRERELSLIEHDDYHKLLLVRQFKATGRKLWPVLKCMPPEAPEEVERLLQSGYHPRIILYDLPGQRSMPKVSFGCSRRWTLSLCP